MVFYRTEISIPIENKDLNNNLTFFKRQFEIFKPNIQLFFAIFIIAILAKGAVIFRGYSIDDYGTISGLDPNIFDTLLGQGRYIMAAIAWILDSLGVNLNDLYFSTGLITLILQTFFLVSIFRFVGLAHLRTAGLVGGLIIAHPYWTEILSFRVLLPPYCVALVFAILTLELLTQENSSDRSKPLAVLFSTCMLFTYQSLLNYFVLAIVFSYLIGHLWWFKNKHSGNVRIYRKKALDLTLVLVTSLAIYIIVTTVVTGLGFAVKTSRSDFISMDKVPERFHQLLLLLKTIYWADEPVFQGWLKTLVAFAVIASIAVVLRELIIKRNIPNSRANTILILVTLTLLLPISAGVIVALSDWWPIPRVLAHVGVVMGLVFLASDFCMPENKMQACKSVFTASRVFITVGFIFLSNQILADQQRINEWDKMMASRIIARLEIEPGFKKVRYVHLSAGSWGYPSRLRMVQGDMNVSAFFVDYSKVSLLVEVSGYWLVRSFGDQVTLGNDYCKHKKPWPHVESIVIYNNLAIVCLNKIGE